MQAAAEALGLELSGMDAIVVGRSNIVGKPMAQMLLGENCTVTIAHSQTRDLAAAVGRVGNAGGGHRPAEMVTGDWIRPGAAVIDVGINRVAGQGSMRRTAKTGSSASRYARRGAS